MFNSLLIKRVKLCLVLLGIFSSFMVSAQTRITGRVIGNDDKQAVIGASVKVRGTTTGTVTDISGNFSIAVKPTDVISVSYLGYQTRDITVGNQTTLRITLSTSTSSLNEVVVTGYTTQRKKDISGAVATVNISTAKSLATTSSDQLLQGQASGVTVITQGTPGSDASVLVRGISNFGNSQPLYVIDGVQTSSMRDVNPDDIESISVLKDAGAAAIYGVSGGNGVVVVTTKKGKEGKSVITYNAYYGTQRPLGGNPFNVLNADEYQQVLNNVDPTNPLLVNGKLADFGYQGPTAKGNANAGDPAVSPSLYRFDPNNAANDYQIQQFVKGAGTDWFHTIFKPAIIQQHTISASGANNNNSYFTSLGYTNQQGTLVNQYYKRYQARVNTNFNIKKHIRFGENGQVFYTQSPGGLNGGNQAEGNPISESYRIEPQIPVYDIAGNYGGTYAGLTQLGNATNPLATQQRIANNYNYSWNVIGTTFAEVDFLNHFTARTAFSGQISNNYYTTIGYNTYDSGEGHALASSATEGASFYSNYNWTNTLNYNQIFGKHNVKFIAGYEMKSNYNRFVAGAGQGLFSTDPNYANVSNTISNKVVTSGVNFVPYSILSYFARLDYQFNDKYILGATIRRDGTSVFAPGKQYGTFPSVSLAWRVSQEDFLKGVSWLNDLKLRGSYGAAGFSGNVPGANAFNLFSQGATTGTSWYAINGSNTPTTGFYNSNIGNKNTTWETDKIANGGFDATLFNNKLDLTAEYFVKNSSNLLFPVTLPATVGGAGAPYVNVGSVRNKGFDIAATYHLRPSSDLSFDISANITTFKNTITKLDSDFPTANTRIGYVVNEAVGHPIGSFYGYKQIGYFSSAADVAASPTQAGAAPGAFKFADINGDGKVDINDRTFIGNPNPNFTYGINLSAKYKSFDLLAVFYGSQGNKDLNYVKYWTEFYSSITGNKNKDMLYDSWSPTNLNPKTVSPTLPSSFSTDQNMSSYYVENGSFLKMRTLQIGYTFSPVLLKKVGVDRFRIYVQGANLFTITKYTGLDPEIQASSQNGNGNNAGIDYGGYPNNERRYLFGVNLSF